MGLIHGESGSFRHSLGLLVLRAVVGAAFIMHGWPKIQNPQGWMGEKAEVSGALQTAAAVSEFGGGIALVAGLLTPLAALSIAITMGYAIAMYHLPQGHVFFGKPGESYELAAVYLAAAVTILLVGPGCLSLDRLFFGKKKT